jgi:hypothetical protein
MMKTSYDSFTKIAHGKKVCQDFADAGLVHVEEYGDDIEMAYGALADGCSSALESESGAVDLVSSLEPYLYPGCDFLRAYMGACGRADALRSVRGKNKQSLYATLLSITLDGDMFRTAMSGDGFDVFRRRGTSIYEVRHIEYTANAPPYPIYFLTHDLHDYDAMCEQQKNKRVEKRYVIDVTTSSMVEESVIMPWKLSISNGWMCDTNEKDVANYDLGLIFSDGLDSFRDETDAPVDLLSVLQVFLNFKMLQGEFLQRRMNVAWAEVAQRGWHNTDDFSVAGISHIE